MLYKFLFVFFCVNVCTRLPGAGYTLATLEGIVYPLIVR